MRIYNTTKFYLTRKEIARHLKLPQNCGGLFRTFSSNLVFSSRKFTLQLEAFRNSPDFEEPIISFLLLESRDNGAFSLYLDQRPCCKL